VKRKKWNTMAKGRHLEIEGSQKVLRKTDVRYVWTEKYLEMKEWRRDIFYRKWTKFNDD
jgi:hypothetical protein